MFYNISINLSGPICTCETEDLAWNTLPDDNRRLIIFCKFCKTELAIPRTKFSAYFKLDKPYPNGPASKQKDAKVLKLVPKDGQDN